MEEKAFQELLESIKQVKAIINGKRRPSRVFVIEHDKKTNTYKRWRKDYSTGKLVRVKGFFPPPVKMKLKRIKLTREERAIEDALIKGEFVPVSKTLSIPIKKHALESLKQKAKKRGVKYQTFISEILHRVAHS